MGHHIFLLSRNLSYIVAVESGVKHHKSEPNLKFKVNRF